MSIDVDEVKKIAYLARLAIDEKNIEQYANDLSRILTLVEEMNKVDTTDVTPMAHPLDTVQRLRNDEVTEANQREDFQSCTPHVEAGLYLVPKVID